MMPPLLEESGTCSYDQIVKKFDNTGEDTDDLISIGTVGLIKGIDTFNPERGTRLATYAARCIENDYRMTDVERKILGIWSA